VNMDGSDDPFYRYTMPAVAIKVPCAAAVLTREVEGTTKMIKTLITNIDDLCAAVGRPVDCFVRTSVSHDADLITYFGQELSANSKIDPKTAKCYVTGNCKQEDLQRCCYKFIQDFVMCKACKNPETYVVVEGKKKNKTVFLMCRGCGNRTNLDDTDRFVKHMLLHPIDSAAQVMPKVLKKSLRVASVLTEAGRGRSRRRRRRLWRGRR
jgi:translation initiation factor 5